MFKELYLTVGKRQLQADPLNDNIHNTAEHV